jgi:hypothetical protein
VLEQHIPWLLCACAKVLLHVVAFNVIMSDAPPVFVLHHAPRARQATVQPEARTCIIAWISWLWPRSAVRFHIKCSNHELSYALLARARESFELCSHFKSLPPIPDRELSTDLTWRAHRRKPEFPTLGSGTQSRCVLGDRGVNSTPGLGSHKCHVMSCHVMSCHVDPMRDCCHQRLLTRPS